MLCCVKSGASLTEKAALLAVQTWPLPDGTPGPFGDKLLSRTRETSGVPQSLVNVLASQYFSTNLQSLFEELFVQGGKL